MQFHPVAYLVKVSRTLIDVPRRHRSFVLFQLEIEMCMSKLMIKVATGTGITVYVSEQRTETYNQPSLTLQILGGRGA